MKVQNRTLSILFATAVAITPTLGVADNEKLIAKIDTLAEKCEIETHTRAATKISEEMTNLAAQVEGLAVSLEQAAKANICRDKAQAAIAQQNRDQYALRKKREQNENQRKAQAAAREQESKALAAARERERQAMVIRDALEACMQLDERDPIAARTNEICHELFLRTKYK